jgi:phage-related minor tail protein
MAVIGVSLIAIEKVGKVLLLLGAGFASLKASTMAFAASLASIGKISAITTARLGTVAIASARLIKPLAIAAALVYVLNTAIKVFSGKSILEWFERLTGFVPSIENVIGAIEKLYRAIGEIASFAPNQLGKLLGIEGLENAGNVFTGIANKLKSIREGMIDENADNAEIQRLKNKAEGQKEISAALAKQGEKAKEIREVEDQRARAMAQFRTQQKQNLDDLQYGLRLDVARIAFERDLIVQNGQLLNLTEDQVQENRMLYQLEEQRAQAVRQLRAQIDQLTISRGEDVNAQSKILVLQQQIRDINKTYLDETSRVAGALRSFQDAQYTSKVIEEDRLRTLENITAAYDQQKSRLESLAGQMKNVNDMIADAEFQRGTQGMMPFEIDIARMLREIDKAALAAKQQFAESFGDEDALGPERVAELVKGLDTLTARFDLLKATQLENANTSRLWSTGWAEAFAQFADDASNAANMAREAFSAVTSNMNSAIDKFVETGKFRFGDLAASIIRDLIKIELKATASKLMSPLLSGLGAGIGKILGFANGGNPPVNRPSIVGERGPELFVPKTAGTVVPNHALGGGANVTNNYITNNISAVDAKSVAQLFAENRRQLLGTVRLAEKESSYR